MENGHQIDKIGLETIWRELLQDSNAILAFQFLYFPYGKDKQVSSV